MSSKLHHFGTPLPFTGLPIWQKVDQSSLHLVEFHVTHTASSHENFVKFQWRGPEIVGKMLRFWQFCNFQEVAKVHCSQQLQCWGPLYLAQIFFNVCSFRPLFQICDILCYSKVIRLESAEVGEKSPNCGAKFADFHLWKCREYRQGPLWSVL